MSIHQIEYEILEGRFWNGWLQDHPDYLIMNGDTFLDLQPERAFSYPSQVHVRQVNHWLKHWFSQRRS